MRPRIVLFSWPDPLPGELSFLTDLVAEFGIGFHLRRPEGGIAHYRNFLERSPNTLLERTVIHEYPELSRSFPVAGIHFNKRNPLGVEGAIPPIIKNQKVLSCSVHEPERILSLPGGIDRVFISPLFDSLSKGPLKGRSEETGFQETAVQNAQKRGFHLYGLGGVTPNNIGTLGEKGFYGAALLGCVWKTFKEKGKEDAKGVISECFQNFA